MTDFSPSPSDSFSDEFSENFESMLRSRPERIGERELSAHSKLPGREEDNMSQNNDIPSSPQQPVPNTEMNLNSSEPVFENDTDFTEQNEQNEQNAPQSEESLTTSSEDERDLSEETSSVLNEPHLNFRAFAEYESFETDLQNSPETESNDTSSEYTSQGVKSETKGAVEQSPADFREEELPSQVEKEVASLGHIPFTPENIEKITLQTFGGKPNRVRESEKKIAERAEKEFTNAQPQKAVGEESETVQNEEKVLQVSEGTSSSDTRTKEPERQLYTKRRFSQQAIEVVKFIATGVGIFVLTLGVLNFQAYYQIFTHTFFPEKNIEKQVELRESTRKKVFATKPPLLPVAGIERHDVPKIQSFLEVTPPDNRLVIEKIGKNVPIVTNVGVDALFQGNWKNLESDIQTALQNGVVHYPGTAEAGEEGNFFVTGHSSYYFWDPGKYKEVFALLGELEVGDRFTVYFKQKKYVYEIFDRKIVEPEDTSVLDQPPNERVASLMTCYPPGTTLKRLVYVAKQIEPAL